ncbi:MAG: Gfo/Idh/MocA family oxidoreductase, partial [Candidatus Omnitrophica bacterium]|nr:Gfo/Idh/MocA family oxidoreductase [Candidatus Omnitrophota bacterium]
MSGTTSHRIRLGVFGVGASLGHSARGYLLATKLERIPEIELVAVCDSNSEKLEQASSALSVTGYTDFDRFLDHDMDAILLANFFHEHAPFAIRALNSGRHVLSETTACFDPSEGVELVRAAEASGKVYMLAENYAYFSSNLEMKRLYESGDLGELKFAEGEYVHPMPSGFQNSIAPGRNHWRNWMPITFYCTHSLAPILHITGLRPVRVSAFAIPRDPTDNHHFGETTRINDLASVFLVQFENGAVAKILWGQL